MHLANLVKGVLDNLKKARESCPITATGSGERDHVAQNFALSLRRLDSWQHRESTDLYEYEEAEVRKAVKALRDAVSEAEARFGKVSGRGGGNFKL